MFLMRTYPLRWQLGGAWALEIKSFLGPMKWHRADRRVPFGTQTVRYIKARSGTQNMFCFKNRRKCSQIFTEQHYLTVFYLLNVVIEEKKN
jgi:hypothetical protein